MTKDLAGPTVKITLEFESEAEANRWLNQRPWTPPPTAAGSVSEKDVDQAVATYSGDGNYWGDVKSLRKSLRRVLNNFLERRGVATEPVEFSDERVDAAVFAYGDGAPDMRKYRERMRRGLRAAGAKP